MKRPPRPQSDGRSWARLLTGLAIVLAGLIVVMQSGFGMLERRATPQGVPMSYLVAAEPVRIDWHAASHEGHELLEEEETADELLPKLPGVVIAHGFAANRRLMSAYAYDLAHAGYAVVSFDFSGHGDNTQPFDPERLQAQVDAAYEFLVSQVEVDPTRIALVGHSMGSGVVMRAALRHPERYSATVALSPVGAEVTPLTPRNLQLQAGAWEPRFVANAEALLERAGGSSDDFASGRARELVTVSAADHLAILFRRPSHDAVVRWLDHALDADPALREPYTDRRIIGWLLQIVGWMIVVSAMAVAYPEPEEDRVRRPLAWAGAALAPIVATLLFAVLSVLFDPTRIFGVLVGGGVALWMLYAGTIYMATASRLRPPSGPQLLRGGMLFAILWVILGLSGEFVWMDWGLTGWRLWLWPLFALTSIPWFVAATLVQEESGRSRWLVWAIHTVGMIAGLWLLARLVPGMELVSLLLPLVAFFLAVLSYMATRFNDPWVAGIGAGAFWGWLLASAFPLVG